MSCSWDKIKSCLPLSKCSNEASQLASGFISEHMVILLPLGHLKWNQKLTTWFILAMVAEARAPNPDKLPSERGSSQGLSGTGRPLCPRRHDQSPNTTLELQFSPLLKGLQHPFQVYAAWSASLVRAKFNGLAQVAEKCNRHVKSESSTSASRHFGLTLIILSHKTKWNMPLQPVIKVVFTSLANKNFFALLKKTTTHTSKFLGQKWQIFRETLTREYRNQGINLISHSTCLGLICVNYISYQEPQPTWPQWRNKQLASNWVFQV